MNFLEEVFKALNDCCRDKSPGPNGMTVAFLQATWDNLRVILHACLMSSSTLGNLG